MSGNPFPDAVDYVLKMSSTASFNSVAKELHLTGTSTEVTGLDAGEYFWNVVAIGPGKKESEPSDTYKFTLVAQGKSADMLLVVDETVLHGSVVEIIGHTEPSAALIINGNNVAGIKPDGHFSYFTEPLSKGSHTIMITGQNRRGGTQNVSRANCNSVAIKKFCLFVCKFSDFVNCFCELGSK